MNARESRPGTTSTRAAHDRNSTGPDSTLTTSDIASAMPVYVLIVRTPTDRIGRRVFLSLHGAVKACERAQARGHAASLELARYVGGGEPR